MTAPTRESFKVKLAGTQNFTLVHIPTNPCSFEQLKSAICKKCCVSGEFLITFGREGAKITLKDDDDLQYARDEGIKELEVQYEVR